MFEKTRSSLNNCSWTLVFFLGMLAPAVGGDVFTSFHDMETLAHQESRLLDTLSDYIFTQQENLNLLRKKLEQLEKVRSAAETTENLITHPIHAFSLVRRLMREWPLILNMMTTPINVKREMKRLPSEEDMEGAVRGVTRLQDVYKMDTKRLAEGPPLLCALDCFDIGNHLLKRQKYTEAMSWFDEALNKIKYNNDTTIQAEKLFSHLYLATLKSICTEEVETRSTSSSEVLQLLLNQYPDYRLDRESSLLFRQVSVDCPMKEESAEDEGSDAYYEQLYSKMCRGIGHYFSSEERCFYVHYNNPRLLIAPFKMEELHINPPLLMFHDVISDQEINDMKDSFIKVRGKCAIRDPNEISEEDKYHRMCDVGWVQSVDTETAARLQRRVGDMTNLNMESSEPHQIASYGLGGEYKLHHDDIIFENYTMQLEGDRVATYMIYLNDVESGGHTVFPNIGVTVKPQKGTAVFWFNLVQRDEELTSMYHGGCPVLRGSKWVLNKWMHEGGQDCKFFAPGKGFPKHRYYLPK